MKGTLFCKIFGHKFAANSIYENGNMLPSGVQRRMSLAYCYRCGLSKKELGITNLETNLK